MRKEDAALPDNKALTHSRNSTEIFNTPQKKLLSYDDIAVFDF